MAARIHTANNAQVRERIQTTQLVKRLQDNAMGEITLDKERIRSIEILLKKTLPDLSAIQHTGDPDKPIKLEIGWKSGK